MHMFHNMHMKMQDTQEVKQSWKRRTKLKTYISYFQNLLWEQCMVAHVYSTSFMGSTDRRIMVWDWPQAKPDEPLPEK
jgi:hypothetical protein